MRVSAAPLTHDRESVDYLVTDERSMISDRPHARNALDHHTKRGSFDGFNSFEADDALALVLTGAGIRRSRNPLRSSAWKPSRQAVIHPGMRCAPVPCRSRWSPNRAPSLDLRP
jgi:hypothetical protein